MVLFYSLNFKTKFEKFCFIIIFRLSEINFENWPELIGKIIFREMMGLRVCFDLYFDDEIEIQIWNVDIIYLGYRFLD